jgi:hypothetical protein
MSQWRKSKSPSEAPHWGVVFSYLLILLQRISLPGNVPRNSANSVELLMFVTNQGSGPTLAVTCSTMALPIGVGPKAIE